jgi:hypothetical protein
LLPRTARAAQIVLVVVLESAFVTALPNHPKIGFTMALQDFVRPKNFEDDDEDENDFDAP